MWKLKQSGINAPFIRDCQDEPKNKIQLCAILTSNALHLWKYSLKAMGRKRYANRNQGTVRMSILISNSRFQSKGSDK